VPVESSLPAVYLIYFHATRPICSYLYKIIARLLPAKIVCALLIVVHSACPAHFILLDLITPVLRRRIIFPFEIFSIRLLLCLPPTVLVVTAFFSVC